ncbi:MAG: DUF4198 domain-containing protein [Chitinophagaceae bacterium]
MKRLALFVLVSLFAVGTVSAHAVWIETNAAGKKGSKHEVRVYFGEFGENERDTVAKWFSDLKEIKVWLVGPGQQKIQLNTKDAVDHLQAEFTPSADGVYTILIYHVVKDLHAAAKIEYNASATVIVGQAANQASFNTNELSIFSVAGGAAKVNTPVKLQAFYQQQPAAKQQVEVVAPGGWEKKPTADANGTVSVVPVMPGTYMAEVLHSIKEAGEHNGKHYENIWKVATYSFAVAK